ncbi:NHL repeat containing protein [Pseudopedobacter saltans DSM 12145]|uniref:NHL repeat containing protein n=1 Tax=Pseudopedobacter saltans (strain ATCC 51119 / DSM 12145 / JCM 21818 / CCUG 39354 / LMG 10337 / NBRC 100064 / NCIMB 13643) TaxID=762903 RepID=F0S713_PSESL|nr:sorbosone dehydrogenase family protein [Pseudopedobacter saltans]ADY53276.1 NHL repeat containing protein [Pseudopedobacter saltans DSM 12145]
MKNLTPLFCIAISTLYLSSCSSSNSSDGKLQDTTKTINENGLPEPYATRPTSKNSKVINWPNGKTPVAPEGFVVKQFAKGLKNPRWIYQLPNGDILVAESNGSQSANRITRFRDTNNDGIPEEQNIFLENLNQPFGMLLIGNTFYVANTDGLIRYSYSNGDTKITGSGNKILSLPAGGYNNHWTRNIITNSDHSKIYVSVGSGSNVGENGMDNEVRRANILEINPDGSGEIIFASGLRNPVGMDWAPGTNVLWTAVNERDNLGDDLVPDYITSVQKGGFYGWPYSYWGKYPDPRLKGERPDLVAKAIVPDVNLGSHTASLGLAFNKGDALGSKYKGGAFVGQHGSWNRSEFVGYKVVYVPFSNGKPSGKPEDFLTGFIADAQKSEVYGRPVGVTFLQNGNLLVADDAAGIIWHVARK